MTDHQEHQRRIKLYKLAELFVWSGIWVGICLLLAYIVLTNKVDLP